MADFTRQKPALDEEKTGCEVGDKFSTFKFGNISQKSTIDFQFRAEV